MRGHRRCCRQLHTSRPPRPNPPLASTSDPTGCDHVIANHRGQAGLSKQQRWWATAWKPACQSAPLSGPRQAGRGFCRWCHHTSDRLESVRSWKRRPGSFQWFLWVMSDENDRILLVLVSLFFSIIAINCHFCEYGNLKMLLLTIRWHEIILEERKKI